MSQLFWRYENMTDTQRGYDGRIAEVTLQKDVETVIPDAAIVEKLGANKDSPLSHFPTVTTSSSSFQSLSVTTKELVYTCRVNHPGVLPKHDIYALLASKQVSYVATMIAYHDMPPHEATRTKDFSGAEWLKFKDAGNSPRSFRSRLVLKEVGRPLQSFRNVKELIQVFRDALQGTFSHYPTFISLANGSIAHRMALDLANILHRDISVGNIMITEEGRGLLVDWDLSKFQTLAMSGALSPPERTVRVVETYLPSSVETHPSYDRALGSSWLLGSR